MEGTSFQKAIRTVKGLLCKGKYDIIEKVNHVDEKDVCCEKQS